MGWISHNFLDRIACCDRAGHPSGSEGLIFFILICVIAGLYLLRKQFRAAYATVELLLVGTWLAVAAATGGSVLSENAESRNEWLIKAAAGIYVGIRGLDNFFSSTAFEGYLATLRSSRRTTETTKNKIALEKVLPDSEEKI